ncbi:MAG: hypothetical protein ACLP5E_03740 [Streptosporangiaceae bacterium]
MSSHSSPPALSGSPFPPIAGCGFLSGCEVPALIAASGNVEWMCLPRIDGAGGRHPGNFPQAFSRAWP